MTPAQTQTEPRLYTFDEFIEWYPDNSARNAQIHQTQEEGVTHRGY